jgi:quinol monooxygenase YgiN
MMQPNFRDAVGMSIVQIARFSVKEGKGEAFGALLRAIVPQTRQEAGCDRYELYKDEAGRWVMFEIWADSAAVDLHMQQPYIVDLIAVLGGFLSEAPDVETLTAVA